MEGKDSKYNSKWLNKIILDDGYGDVVLYDWMKCGYIYYILLFLLNFLGLVFFFC